MITIIRWNFNNPSIHDLVPIFINMRRYRRPICICTIRHTAHVQLAFAWNRRWIKFRTFLCPYLWIVCHWPWSIVSFIHKSFCFVLHARARLKLMLISYNWGEINMARFYLDFTLTACIINSICICSCTNCKISCGST